MTSTRRGFLSGIAGVAAGAAAEVRGPRVDLARKAFAEEKLDFPKHVYGNGVADGRTRA